jgi:hypothetical protein
MESDKRTDLEAMLVAEKYPPPEGLLASCHFNSFIFDTAAGDEWLNDDGWKKSELLAVFLD